MGNGSTHLAETSVVDSRDNSARWDEIRLICPCNRNLPSCPGLGELDSMQRMRICRVTRAGKKDGGKQ
jgi:hypothetical protein